MITKCNNLAYKWDKIKQINADPCSDESENKVETELPNCESRSITDSHNGTNVNSEVVDEFTDQSMLRDVDEIDVCIEPEDEGE